DVPALGSLALAPAEDVAAVDGDLDHGLGASVARRDHELARALDLGHEAAHGPGRLEAGAVARHELERELLAAPPRVSGRPIGLAELPHVPARGHERELRPALTLVDDARPHRCDAIRVARAHAHVPLVAVAQRPALIRARGDGFLQLELRAAA